MESHDFRNDALARDLGHRPSTGLREVSSSSSNGILTITTGNLPKLKHESVMAIMNSSLPAWATVARHSLELKTAHLRDLYSYDPLRWENFHVESGHWLLDYSRQRITKETLSLLIGLARAADLPSHIAAMFRGDAINSTEGRAVLHTALRSDFAGGAGIQSEVRASRKKLSEFADAVRRGDKRGITGRQFRHVVNIGIGGSDLGPLLVCDALRHEWSGGITPHFVSNVDRTQLEDLTRTLDPAETLVLVCSKTFVTQETQANANAARAWIVGALGEKSPANHFVAVSTNASAMDAFGIALEHRFTMWDWVGGRYSVWSAIGLVAELTIGSEKFQEFLSGAGEIDQHFTNAPFAQFEVDDKRVHQVLSSEDILGKSATFVLLVANTKFVDQNSKVSAAVVKVLAGPTSVEVDCQKQGDSVTVPGRAATNWWAHLPAHGTLGGQALRGVGVGTQEIIQIEKHRRTLRGGGDEFMEFAESVRLDNVAFVGSEIPLHFPLARENVEVIEPEIVHHLL